MAFLLREYFAVEKLAAFKPRQGEVGNQGNVGVAGIIKHSVEQDSVVMAHRNHEIWVFHEGGKNTATGRRIVGVNTINIDKSPRHTVLFTLLKIFLHLHGALMFFHIFFDYSFQEPGLGGKRIKQSSFRKSGTGGYRIKGYMCRTDFLGQFHCCTHNALTRRYLVP